MDIRSTEKNCYIEARSGNIDIAKLLGFSLDVNEMNANGADDYVNRADAVEDMSDKELYISTMAEPTGCKSSSSSTPPASPPTSPSGSPSGSPPNLEPHILLQLSSPRSPGQLQVRQTSDPDVTLSNTDHVVVANNSDPIFTIPPNLPVGKEFVLSKIFIEPNLDSMKSIKVNLPDNTIVVGRGFMTMTDIPNFSRMVNAGTFGPVNVWMII
jgi:hypothetical protein